MRMKSINIIAFVLLFLALNLFAQNYSYDYSQMTMDEYRAELAKWQKCEADNKAKITEEEAQIAKLNDEISTVENQIASAWNDIYALLGTDKAGYEAYMAQLERLKSDLTGFVALSPEDIYARRSEIDGYKNRLAELKKSKISLATRAQNLIADIEGLIAEAEAKARPAAAGMYEVIRGDYLWKISKKPEIYDDPYAWIRIYTYNRDQIQNPDLIFPKQVFRIPRMAGPDEYWVKRGEFLYQIAGYSNVLGNSFSWQKLYEANKDNITDPNLIYPHMVLKIPR
jgi:nucleoid-associated protein YgaU